MIVFTDVHIESECTASLIDILAIIKFIKTVMNRQITIQFRSYSKFFVVLLKRSFDQTPYILPGRQIRRENYRVASKRPGISLSHSLTLTLSHQ